ncbi:hypothetical protein FACS189421_14530 [Bacteroidia bacterium]|nr:hypothetical protein FACS189421_14530 [Bacteroidia bacterium]
MDLDANNAPAAEKKLTDLAREGNSRDWRDLATFRLAIMRADSMTGAGFEKFTAALQTKKSPFYYTGALIVGQKYLSEGDRINAGAWFDKIINDQNAPTSIKASAESMR